MYETNNGEGGIVYNVTTKVSANINNAWLRWMQQEHIPAILQTGFFTGYRILRLLEVDGDEESTYAVQYFATDLVDYDRYIREHAAAFRQDAIQKWGLNVVSFRSVMEVIA